MPHADPEPASVREFLKIHTSTVGLSSSAIDKIADVATLRKYSRGEKALVDGEPVPAVALVVSGHFAICRDGECTMLVGGLGPNDLLGLLQLRMGSRRR